jgi:hypothetical protein
MNQNQEHVRFDVLNDYVDGLLAGPDIALVDKHLESCSECAGVLSRLRDLLSTASGLSPFVLPDVDIWSDIKRTVESRKERVLPITDALAPAGKGRRKPAVRWQSPSFLVAAAVVLIVASSGVTAVVLRWTSNQGYVQVLPEGRAPEDAMPGPGVLPASFTRTEGEYSRAIDELVEAAKAQRGHLSPETIRTIDHSIAVIDSAITEARQALVADPNNTTLVDLLSASYQRKLDLLRRTSELSSRI